MSVFLALLEMTSDFLNMIFPKTLTLSSAGSTDVAVNNLAMLSELADKFRTGSHLTQAYCTFRPCAVKFNIPCIL